MNVSTMRKIDKSIGSVICLALNFYEVIRSLFTPRRIFPPPGTVLVTKYLGMGSILFTNPALKALKDKYPACRIVLLTFEENADFSSNIPIFDSTIIIRTSSLFLFVKDSVAAIFVLRRLHFDYVFDFEFFSRYSIIISYLSSATCRVGFCMPQVWRGNLLHVPVFFDPRQHISKVFAAQVEAIGIRVNDYTVSPLAASAAALDNIKKHINLGESILQNLLVLVNVNASELSLERRWSVENFLTLINAVALRDNVSIVLVGAASEVPYVSELYSTLSATARKSVLNLAGKTNLDELIALLSLCDLFITNDSGPLHIAAAVGVRTVSFFGPETPELYGPQGEGHLVFYADADCSPCLNAYNAKIAMCNGDNRCMKAIQPDEVIRAVTGILDGIKRHVL